jgi:hypothetical protein
VIIASIYSHNSRSKVPQKLVGITVEGIRDFLNTDKNCSKPSYHRTKKSFHGVVSLLMLELWPKIEPEPPELLLSSSEFAIIWFGQLPVDSVQVPDVTAIAAG